jgi:hypothetical protein
MPNIATGSTGAAPIGTSRARLVVLADDGRAERGKRPVPTRTTGARYPPNRACHRRADNGAYRPGLAELHAVSRRSVVGANTGRLAVRCRQTVRPFRAARAALAERQRPRATSHCVLNPASPGCALSGSQGRARGREHRPISRGLLCLEGDLEPSQPTCQWPWQALGRGQVAHVGPTRLTATRWGSARRALAPLTT